MSTIIEHARCGKITRDIEEVAKNEGKPVDFIMQKVASGEIVILKRHSRKNNSEIFLGTGAGLKTKINVNLGTSSEGGLKEEIEKARISQQIGADTICEMSMSGDIDTIRSACFDATTMPITTVPIYQAVAEKVQKGKGFLEIGSDDIVGMIEKHVKSGVSGVVLHAAITRGMLEDLKRSKRIMGMVSKGGALTSAYMLENNIKNPFAENLTEILEILHEHDAVLILGNAMRSGSVCDKMDNLHIMEMELNREYANTANRYGVQVIVEGLGGHIAAGDIEKSVKLYKESIRYPLFVAGPLPTDIAAGYDHIAGCAGASTASAAGADYLCYITPSEHISLPGADDVREGIIAFKIAAVIGDSVKYGLSESEKRMAFARRSHNWSEQFDLAADHGARAREKGKKLVDGAGCTMCGRYCAIDIMKKFMGG